MSSAPTPLRGVIVATALPFKENPSAPAGLEVDYDRYAEHCDWLISNGCHGVGPNGSLGEYSALTDAERRQVVRVAVEAVGGRGVVVAGVHGPGWHQAKHWAELAAEDGADAVLALPPTMYRASPAQVVEHYAKIDEVGLPIMIYNNPIDTKVDLETFFAKARINPNVSKITGLICGYRVENIEDKLMQQIRYMDKLVDEIARGRPMEKILRTPVA